MTNWILIVTVIILLITLLSVNENYIFCSMNNLISCSNDTACGCEDMITGGLKRTKCVNGRCTTL